MQFSDREAVIRVVKCYNISKGVDYKVYKSEAMTFYYKCVWYDIDCEWLVRASFQKNKYCWEIRKYNSPHTCTRARISQDHTKLDSYTIAKCIKPTVESDSSFMIKSVIAKI